MSTINKKSLLYVTVFLLAGCLNEHNVAGEIGHEASNQVTTLPSQTCNIPKNAFDQLPAEVLYGTDVVDINDFKPANVSGMLFHNETGGARMELEAQAQNGRYKIQRIYKEPDQEKIVANYNNLCIDNGHLYGENVRGIFTEKGILWLELKSGHEFISSDLWIYLEKN